MPPAKARSGRTAARRRTGRSASRAAGGRATRTPPIVEVARWWEKVRKSLAPTRRPRSATISCAGPISELTGPKPNPIYHDISTKYANWPSGAHVDFVSFPFQFGAYVPVTYTSIRTGFAFFGAIPICTKSSVCSNGQPMVWKVYLAGALKTSTDEMNYTYTVNVLCGGVLTCVETGTFKGTRKKGTSGSLDGSFYGEHEWKLKCCPKRHAPTG